MVVVAVAFVEMLLRLNEVIYAPFYALFLVGPSALLIEMAHGATVGAAQGSGGWSDSGLRAQGSGRTGSGLKAQGSGKTLEITLPSFCLSLEP